MMKTDVLLRLFQSLLETDELMHAWMCERIAIYGTLDYKFFEWYYSKRIYILSSIIEELEDIRDFSFPDIKF